MKQLKRKKIRLSKNPETRLGIQRTTTYAKIDLGGDKVATENIKGAERNPTPASQITHLCASVDARCGDVMIAIPMNHRRLKLFIFGPV